MLSGIPDAAQGLGARLHACVTPAWLPVAGSTVKVSGGLLVAKRELLYGAVFYLGWPGSADSLCPDEQSLLQEIIVGVGGGSVMTACLLGPICTLQLPKLCCAIQIIDQAHPRRCP